MPRSTRYQDARDTKKYEIPGRARYREGPRRAQDVSQAGAKAPRPPPRGPQEDSKRAPRGLQEGSRMKDNSKTLQDTSPYAKTFVLPRVFNAFTHTLRYIRRATYAKTLILPRVFDAFKINPPPNEGNYMQKPSFYLGFSTLLK